MSGTEARSVRVLLVEDNPADAELIREVLSECGLRTTLTVAKTGDKALDIMLSDNPPEVVLLDLNLGVMSGLEILRELKVQRPDFLVKVPVIVLTSSTLEQDVHSALALGAKCYHVKPMGLSKYVQLVRVIYDHWLDFAVLPRYRPPSE